MRTLVILALICATAMAASSLRKPQPVNDQATQDFVTGFFLAMRAAEKMPHAFDCATSATGVQSLFAEFQAKFDANPSVGVVLEYAVKMLPALKAAATGCGAVGKEAMAYFKEIEQIVTCRLFINHLLAPTFVLVAGKALFTHRAVVIQDIKDYKEAKAEEQNLVAGMKVGEIGRIAVWGSPCE